MLVSVTGGTGFVGSHTVAALVAAGHRVRLLVRDESTVDDALGPLAVPPSAVDIVVGNALCETSAAKLARGADALVHAASLYSFDSRRHGLIRATNERSTELILSAARRAGIDPIIHVSSVAAMCPAAERMVRADSPVGAPRETYMASKAAAEVIARGHQAQGVPVVITYPPALLGPHDPNLGDQTTRLRNVLRGAMPVWPEGGLPIGDVRDTAALHASLLDARPDEGNRYFGPGHFVTTREYLDLVREVTGRSLPTLFLPARGMLPLGMIADVVQRVSPWRLPAEYGSIYVCASSTRVDRNAPTNGISARPLRETIARTVRWLHDNDYLSAKQAGVVTRRLTLVDARQSRSYLPSG